MRERNACGTTESCGLFMSQGSNVFHTRQGPDAVLPPITTLWPCAISNELRSMRSPTWRSLSQNVNERARSAVVAKDARCSGGVSASASTTFLFGLQKVVSRHLPERCWQGTSPTEDVLHRWACLSWTPHQLVGAMTPMDDRRVADVQRCATAPSTEQIAKAQTLVYVRVLVYRREAARLQAFTHRAVQSWERFDSINSSVYPFQSSLFLQNIFARIITD